MSDVTPQLAPEHQQALAAAGVDPSRLNLAQLFALIRALLELFGQRAQQSP